MVVKHNISRPVRIILWNGQIQPWLVVSIVMDDSGVLYLWLIKGWVIAKSQDMPTSIQWIRQVIESDQSRWQWAKFPKGPILILQNSFTSVASLSSKTTSISSMNEKASMFVGQTRNRINIRIFIKTISETSGMDQKLKIILYKNSQMEIAITIIRLK